MATRRQRQKYALWMAIGLLLGLLTVIGTLQWQDRQSASQQRLFDGNFQRIDIERPGHTTLALLRTDDQWQFTEPCQRHANAERIEPLLTVLLNLQQQYASTEVDLAAAGLLDPLAVMQVDGKRLAIGALDVSDQRRYVMLDDAIAFVPEWVLSLLQGGLSALADLLVLPTSATGIEDAAGAAQPLTPWQALSAQQVVTWPLSSTAEVPEILATESFRVTLADNTTRTLEVQKTDAYSAIVMDGSDCALLVDNSSIPAHTSP